VPGFSVAEKKSSHIDVASLESRITFGASGAPTVAYGPQLDAVTKLTTGVYQFAYHQPAAELMGYNAAFHAIPFAAGTVGTGASATAITMPLNRAVATLKDATKFSSFGAVLCNSVANTNAITINGQTFTGVTHSGALTDSGSTWQFDVQTSDAACALAIASTINACTNAKIKGIVYAAAYGAYVFVWSYNPVVTWSATATRFALSHATTLQQGSSLVLALMASDGTITEPANGDSLKFCADFAYSNLGIP
jgi:hypothetical protein